ncbi:MAG: hypothetical protein ACKOAX_09205 [Candidatus Kapaibacterium sp.]
MKSLIKKIPGARRVVNAVRRHRARRRPELDAVHQQRQQVLLQGYERDARGGRATHARIADAGFRVFSQSDEDGIILYILASIGMKDRRVVELCCGNGHECMATNLILNHGYEGFLFDGDADNIRSAKLFFASRKETFSVAPVLRQAWITRDNINDLLTSAGVSGEIDLLSLDMDGNDYYIWEAIDVIRPRLCVFETHNIIPGDRSLTIPYDPAFTCWDKKGALRDFRSVSLAAMKKLSEAKGYRMIGAHRMGFNVFFLRNDIAPDLFPAVSIADVHDNPFTRHAQATRWPAVQNLPWFDV